jgi:hypothetical protein
MDQKTIVLHLHMKGIALAHVKRNLIGNRGEKLSDLLVRIQVILRTISGEIFVEVFLEWMKRLQKCIDMNGEYIG